MITCRFDGGPETRLRHVTADIAVIDQGRVLLVRRSPWLVEGGKLAMPGGYMDLDETLVECAVRECREETGFDCTNLRLVNIDSRPDRSGNERENIVGVFVADLGDKVGEADDESTELVWMDVAEAVAIDLAFDHDEQLALVLQFLHDKQRTPFVDGRPIGEG